MGCAHLMKLFSRRLLYLSWAIAGFTFGWFAVGWIGLSNHCDPASWKGGNTCDALKVLHDWQELVAGLAAIVAAYIGGFYILQQIKVTKEQIELSREQAQEGTRRRHAAARAMLPLALAEITQYATSCGQQLKAVHRAAKNQAVPESALTEMKIPPLPNVAINELKQLVESADETLQCAVADMLCEIQILSSRISGLQEPRDPNNVGVTATAYLEDVIINALKVFAYAASLFDYGRRKVDTIPAGEPSSEAQFSAMFNLGFFDDSFEPIRATITRRAQSKE